MSNGEVCCVLGVCCPPDARKPKASATMARDLGLTVDQASQAFEWFDSRFDFAPKGTLQPLIDSIATMAKADHS